MAVINQFMADVLDAVDRQLRARQDQNSTVSQIPQPPNTPSDPTTAPSSSPSAALNQPSGGPTSSPLLFFVALGFGVVFTNLWIIVGVKYCFRYNARNRAIRNGDDVDPISLDQMHARPHRRRREKKLMTMDEVNERFPLMKYKSWVASRARKGLPTSGGVSLPPSRPQSIRDVENVVIPRVSDITSSNECQTLPRNAVDETAVKSARSPQETDQSDLEDVRISEKEALSPNHGGTNIKDESCPHQSYANPSNDTRAASSSDDDDEDDQINTAIPLELLATPGDSCAICIDTLEEEDEIRGLSCGHAFHAGCLDPWLTSRRACCPLCKADYHTPKSRTQGESVEVERTGRRRPDRSSMPLYSQSLWNSIFSSSRLSTPQRSNDQTRERNRRSPWRSREPSTVQASGAIPDNSNQLSDPTHRWNFPSLSNPLRNVRIPTILVPHRNRQEAVESNPNSQTSPSALEAGVSSR